MFRSDKILNPEEAQLSLITAVSHIKQSCQFRKENNREGDRGKPEKPEKEMSLGWGWGWGLGWGDPSPYTCSTSTLLP